MADNYQVTTQEEVTDYSGATAVPSVRVSFTTKPSGVAGTVIVPKSTYSPQAVHDAIQAQADLLEQVQAL